MSDHVVKLNCGIHLVDIEREKVSELEARFTLTLDGIPRLSVLNLTFYTPGLTVGQNRIALWGRDTIAVYDWGIGSTFDWHGDRPFELRDVWERDGCWVLVGELDTAVWSSDLSQEIATHGHRDIVMECRWEEGDLVTVDFNGWVERLAFPSLELLESYQGSGDGMPSPNSEETH